MNDHSADPSSVRLTELAHCGGCGCKPAPPVLQQLLAGQVGTLFPHLLVANETADDAAVWQISDELRGIATTDLFMLIEKPNRADCIHSSSAFDREPNTNVRR